MGAFLMGRATGELIAGVWQALGSRQTWPVRGPAGQLRAGWPQCRLAAWPPGRLAQRPDNEEWLAGAAGAIWHQQQHTPWALLAVESSQSEHAPSFR